MSEESRCMGWVVFRIVRDASGSSIVQGGEVTTTRREYLDAGGGWTWDPNRARRFSDEWVDDGKGGVEHGARVAARAAEAECGEECYVARLFPSRKSEEEAIAARKTQERSDRAVAAAAGKRF